MSPIHAVFFLPLFLAGVCTAEKVVVDLDLDVDAHGVKHVALGCPKADVHVFVVETGHEAHEVKHHGAVVHAVADDAALHHVVLFKHHVHEVLVLHFADGAKKHFVFAEGRHEKGCDKAVAKLCAVKAGEEAPECFWKAHHGHCPHGHVA